MALIPWHSDASMPVWTLISKPHLGRSFACTLRLHGTARACRRSNVCMNAHSYGQFFHVASLLFWRALPTSPASSCSMFTLCEDNGKLGANPSFSDRRWVREWNGSAFFFRGYMSMCVLFWYSGQPMRRQHQKQR